MTNPRFLIVDDYAVMRALLKETLRSIGYNWCDEAPNAKDAIESINKSVVDKQPYALIFLDIAMPEADGYSVLSYCKANAELKNIPVLMISAESEMTAVMKAIDMGAEGYLTKPCTPNIIIQKVQRILAK